MAQTTTELIQAGKDVTVVLTDSEKERLEICEQVITKGLNTFLEVGEALAEIHDNRLYKATHKSFLKYCKDVWDLGKSRAHQKIDGYRVVQLLKEKTSTMVDVLDGDHPEGNEMVLRLNERQTRPLTKLAPDAQVEAWGRVLNQLNDGKKLTAALVAKEVKAVKGEVVTRKIDKEKKQLDSTQLVSKLFNKQAQIMLDIVYEERNSGWKTTSKKEAIKVFKSIIKIIEMDK